MRMYFVPDALLGLQQVNSEKEEKFFPTYQDVHPGQGHSLYLKKKKEKKKKEKKNFPNLVGCAAKKKKNLKNKKKKKKKKKKGWKFPCGVVSSDPAL